MLEIRKNTEEFRHSNRSLRHECTPHEQNNYSKITVQYRYLVLLMLDQMQKLIKDFPTSSKQNISHLLTKNTMKPLNRSSVTQLNSRI